MRREFPATREEVHPTTDGGGVLKDLFSALTEISSLKRSTGAFVGFELVEKDGVVFAVAHVAVKVVYSKADDGQHERSSRIMSVYRGSIRHDTRCRVASCLLG